LPAASVARTRYLYLVDAVRPVLLKLVVAGAAISEKLLQPTPWQRSTR
jgi:hypothetical protein